MLSLLTKIVKSTRSYNLNLVVGKRFIIMDKTQMLQSVKSCIPALDNSKHKGQAGRIGIVGGSLEYTGAPFFAGISAMKVGADLVHVFCASSAATVIKSYSPELIVHPLLDKTNALNEITPWLDRLHAIVIGPGLGRDPNTLKTVTELIGIIKEKKIPLVIDADGLFLLTEKPEIIKDFSSPVVLTPNKIEFERLSTKVKIPDDLYKLGEALVILKKGEIDEVYSSCSNVNWNFNSGGSGRRCGGQGDLLSGSLAIFLHWTLTNIKKLESAEVKKELLASSLACYAASCLVRKCNEKAFGLYGRSMLASNMINQIHSSFQDLFGE